MSIKVNGLLTPEDLRGVPGRDSNGFKLTEHDLIGESEMVLLNRAGMNSILTLVNVPASRLCEVLGIDMEKANEIISWAVQKSYPAVSTQDSELVGAYLDAGLQVPPDSDPLAAAHQVAATADNLVNPPETPDTDKPRALSSESRKSTGFHKIRVEDGSVTGAPSKKATNPEEAPAPRKPGRPPGSASAAK